MPLQMIGRPILRKQVGPLLIPMNSTTDENQTQFSLYRPSAVALANTISDLPFSATRVLMFNVLIYFISGLHRSAGAFFTYHLFSYMAFLSLQGLFRTFGLLCVNFESAFRLSIFFLPNL